MIGHIERAMLASLAVIIAALLIIMAFFQNKAAEDSAKIYSVSVIVSNPRERFVKGVEQAALDFNADVHLVSGYARGDSVRQLEYLERELDNQADAVVVFPENAGKLEEYLGSLNQKAKVVTVGQRLSGNRFAAHVGVDDELLGDELGGLVADEKTDGTCLILCPKDAKPYHANRVRGTKSALDARGIPCAVLYLGPDDIGFALAKRDYASVAVLDESLLVPACEQAREGDIIFGAGFAGGARAWLENGTLRGLIVYSEYDAGYLSVREAVGQAEGKFEPDVETGLYTVRAETMYTPPLVHILFPIG